VHSIWGFVTDFGDTAVTVPLAIVMFGFLLTTRQPVLALGWACAIIGCAGTIGALKIGLAACGYPLGGVGLSSPSGHTAMSTAVYGGYAAVLGSTLAPAARRSLAGATVTLLVAIAVSRAILHYHSPLEVVIGLGVGLATLAAIFLLATRYRSPERLPLGRLALCVAIVALAFHGERWPAERAIHRLAGLLSILRPWCG
jgi:membrane-associated phospholipid phosphatase